MGVSQDVCIYVDISWGLCIYVDASQDLCRNVAISQGLCMYVAVSQGLYICRCSHDLWSMYVTVSHGLCMYVASFQGLCVCIMCRCFFLFEGKHFAFAHRIQLYFLNINPHQSTSVLFAFFPPFYIHPSLFPPIIFSVLAFLSLFWDRIHVVQTYRKFTM